MEHIATMDFQVKVAGETTESECDHKSSFLCTKDVKWGSTRDISVKIAKPNVTTTHPTKKSGDIGDNKDKSEK